MTKEKQKAKELMMKFSHLKADNGAESLKEKVWYFVPTPLLKQCALICCDQIMKIELLKCRLTVINPDIFKEEEFKSFWEKVKQEIINQ